MAQKISLWKEKRNSLDYNFFLKKLLYACHPTIAMITIIMLRVKGLSHKNAHDPSLISKDLLKFSSINPPKTKAKIRGGIGKS